jgi:nucleotide-binding universal stress UspA family protein
MYKKILIPLENTQTDEAIIKHIKSFEHYSKAKILLVHVADGFVARNQEVLNLSDSEEIEGDRAYLKKREDELRESGFEASSILAQGEPAKQILAISEAEGCDLIAMATHGHRWLGDMIFGSVAENIRHRTEIPILMVRGGS